VCEGDLVPFQPWNITSSSRAWTEKVEDAELDMALMELMKAPLFGT